MIRQFLPRKCECVYRTRVGQGKGKWVRVRVLKMAFPALNIGLCPVPSGVTREDVAAVRRRWNAAVGVPIVARKDWHRWSASDKRRLVHDVARNAQGARDNFVTVYEEKALEDVFVYEEWSVEHVVPQSKCPSAQGDVLNMTEATRSANSRRGNLPLVLWREDNGPTRDDAEFRTFDGIRHFAPPPQQRARLARKWLCVRASHACAAPMSTMQHRMLREIIAVAKTHPPSAVEVRVAMEVLFKTGLRNPLVLGENVAQWYDCPVWQQMVCGGVL